jgi:hypothetical protein
MYNEKRRAIRLPSLVNELRDFRLKICTFNQSILCYLTILHVLIDLDGIFPNALGPFGFTVRVL